MPEPGDAAGALEARALVDAAERVVVLTGAGISTDSGIPDFRGPRGVWTKNPEAEKLSNIEYYVRDPDVRRRAWRARMEGRGRQREPNPGHRALLALEARDKLHLLITQNVDGLHHAAGSDPSRIVEIHGTTREYACLGCGDRGPIEVVFARVEAGDDDPACEQCGGILKSATISFGQGLVAEDLARSERAARSCDLMLAVGTTLGVFPIAAVVPAAAESGARVAILNAEPTQMDSLADVVVRGPIGELLPRIVGA